MANLSVRKLDEGAYQLLRVRAKEHKVSLEEEVRQIIYSVVTPSTSITGVFKKYFGKKNGINLDSLIERKPYEPIHFEK
jgi:hypothetical protein